MRRVAIFASGGGSNMQCVINAYKWGVLDMVPVLVISNNSKSGAISRAKDEGMLHYHISSKHFKTENDLGEKILRVLFWHKIDLVLLLGYMKLVPSIVIKHFGGKILNIHPALLPKFGGEGMYGKNVHKAVLAAGEKETGATIHVVDEEYDKGRILAQTVVSVKSYDTVDTLSERVLDKEHELLIDTLQKICEGKLVI